jgi:hypothetical protein
MRLGLTIKSKHEKIMKPNPRYKKILKDEIEKNNKKNNQKNEGKN